MSMKGIGTVFLILLIILAGCERIIDVDLNSASPAIVIQGSLNMKPQKAEVNISQTVSYFSGTSENPVSYAKVFIENREGKKYVLTENNPGYYKSATLSLQYGETYKLTVDNGGVIYTANSKLNPPIEIDSISYRYEKGFAFVDEGYYITLHFNDPAEFENYYRIKVYKNGNYKNEFSSLIVFDDRLINGQNLSVGLPDRVFEIGQKATVELISLDKGAYEYYKTFRELLNVNPGSAAPANPTSNLTNNALGFFSAWSSNQKSVTISEK